MTPTARQRWRLGLNIAAAAVFLFGAASCFVSLVVEYTTRADVRTSFSLARGAVHFVHDDRTNYRTLPGASLLIHPNWHVDLGRVFGRPYAEFDPQIEFHPKAVAPGWSARLPLWIPLVILTAPAAWRCYRRATCPAWACQRCRYDLRGLPPGQCPECGASPSNR